MCVLLGPQAPGLHVSRAWLRGVYVECVCICCVCAGVCVGGGGTCLSPEPRAERGGNKCPPPLLLPSALLLVPLMSKPADGGQRSASQTVQGRASVGAKRSEKSRAEKMWYLCPSLLLHPSALPLTATPTP